MFDPWTRRGVLRGSAAGLAALSMPGFLASCAKQDVQATLSSGGTPDNPFQQWFGIDEATIRRVMTELSSRGADHADLYFQHTRSNSIRLEDGLISEADFRDFTFTNAATMWAEADPSFFEGTVVEAAVKQISAK